MMVETLTMNEAGGIYKMAYEPHRTKSKGTGIGQKRREDAVRKPMKRGGRLRFQSKKQRKRTEGLQQKLQVILDVQVKLYGSMGCEAQRDGYEHECSGILFADHVNTRNRFKADLYENLQAICSNANMKKGSVRKDFRSEKMKKAMKELDK